MTYYISEGANSISPERGSYNAHLSPTLAAVALAAGAVFVTLAAVRRFGPVGSVRFIGATVSGGLLMTGSLAYLSFKSIQKGLNSGSTPLPQPQRNPGSVPPRQPETSQNLGNPQDSKIRESLNRFKSSIINIMGGANPPQKPVAKPTEMTAQDFDQRARDIIATNNLSLLSPIPRNEPYCDYPLNYLRFNHRQEIFWTLLETDEELKPYAQVLASQICFFVCAMGILCSNKTFFLQEDGSCKIICEVSRNIIPNLFSDPANSHAPHLYLRNCLYMLVPRYCHEELDEMVKSMLPTKQELFSDKKKDFQRLLQMRMEELDNVKAFREKRQITTDAPILDDAAICEWSDLEQVMARQLMTLLRKKNEWGYTLNRKFVEISIDWSKPEPDLQLPTELISLSGSQKTARYTEVLNKLITAGFIMGYSLGRTTRMYIHY